MTKVIADISMSLDGYVTARGAGPEHGLGIGGEGIHAWVLEQPRSAVDEHVLASSFENTGAVVMGRRLFDVVDGPKGWGDEGGWWGKSMLERCGTAPFRVWNSPKKVWRFRTAFNLRNLASRHPGLDPGPTFSRRSG